MIQIQLDEDKLEDLAREEIKKRLRENETALTFWDTAELKRRTCMSWNTLQENIFHEEGFPKMKVGGKWYFPAAAAEAFLLEWLKSKQ